jgi:hypothetical protein
MTRIFISYRSDDSRTFVGRIYDHLARKFGANNVFKDVDSIPAGSDFRGVIKEAVSACDVVLVIIGPRWLDAKDKAGQRRLDDPEDFVRIEVETGLQRASARVIPVLVEGAAMPDADALPLALREVAYRNARIIRDDPDFHRDMERLIQSIQRARRWRFDWKWVVGAVLIPIIAALIAGGLPAILGRDSPTPTFAAVLPTDTEAPTNAPPTDPPTNTITPTHTLTPTATFTDVPSTNTNTFTFTTTATATSTSAPTDLPTATNPATPTTMVLPTNTSALRQQSTSTFEASLTGFSASVTTAPEFTQTFSVATYPCGGQIVSRVPHSTMLNVVRSYPSGSAPLKDSVLQGISIWVLEEYVDSQRRGWFQISDIDNQDLGWIPQEYVILSEDCP